MSDKKPNVGGQAVLEGVMMRSPRCFAVAVRRKSGEIVIREQPWEAAWSSKLAKVPFVRGAVTLFESMHNGYSALQFSADQMEKDLLAEERAAAAAAADSETPSDEAAVAARREVEEVAPAASARIEAAEEAAVLTGDAPSGGASGAGTRLAVVFAIAFFIALPQLLAWGVGHLFGPGWGMQDFKFHALTGFFKLGVLLTYLSLIRRVPDVRRVFQYHGAEHKAIATYEAREPLTVEYARKHSTRHARCGTTFLIVVVMVSVLVYAAILPPLLHGVAGWTAQALAIGIKILALPLIAGLAYELQRIGAKFSTNPIANLFLTPGYWVQGITTIEPSDDQLEIALASLRVTLVREAGEQKPASEPDVQTYPSYAAFAESYGGAGYSGA